MISNWADLGSAGKCFDFISDTMCVSDDFCLPIDDHWIGSIRLVWKNDFFKRNVCAVIFNGLMDDFDECQTHLPLAAAALTRFDWTRTPFTNALERIIKKQQSTQNAVALGFHLTAIVYYVFFIPFSIVFVFWLHSFSLYFAALSCLVLYLIQTNECEKKKSSNQIEQKQKITFL